MGTLSAMLVCDYFLSDSRLIKRESDTHINNMIFHTVYS